MNYKRFSGFTFFLAGVIVAQVVLTSLSYVFHISAPCEFINPFYSDKQIFQHCNIISSDTSKDFYNKSKGLVYIGVMTANKFLNTRAKSIYETWAKHIPGKVVFFTSESSDDCNIPLVKLSGVDDETYPPQTKVFYMLKYMYDNHLDDFEFFIRADDDSYIHPEKLEIFLLSLNSSKALSIGQPGIGISGESGHLSLENEGNFCMGGPGVVLTRETLARIGPNIRNCLKTVASFHEDVELGRCITTYANIYCSWAYELQDFFFHNYTGVDTFTGTLKLPEVHGALSLHPIKRNGSMYHVHHYIQSRRIRGEELKLINLMKQLKFVAAEIGVLLPAMDNSLEGFFVDHLALNESTSVENSVNWDYFDKSVFTLSDENPRHGIPIYARESINDIIRDNMQIMDSLSKERGRKIDFKNIVHGYKRNSPLTGMEYIIDLGLIYNKFQGNKMSIPVMCRHHLKVSYGSINVREYHPQDGFRVNRIHTLTGLSSHEAAFDEKSEANAGISEDSLHLTRVNMILPLSGRFRIFQRFIENFRQVCMEKFKDVSLTIVAFASEHEDEDSMQNLEALMKSLQLEYPSFLLKMLKIKSSFSRGMALQLGASVYSPEDLLFFIDVDITFTKNSLDKIRQHTVRGKQVYFPIVYSEFDRSVTGTDFNENIHPVVALDNGYWRSYGYGIVGIYKSDFLNIGGFDTNIVGWGKEDIDVYDKIVSSSLTIFRAPDPGLVHVFHEIQCSPDLAEDQMTMCLGSMYSTYGPVSILASSAFTNRATLLRGSQR